MNLQRRKLLFPASSVAESLQDTRQLPFLTISPDFLQDPGPGDQGRFCLKGSRLPAVLEKKLCFFLADLPGPFPTFSFQFP